MNNKEELKEQKEYHKNLIKECNKELCKNLRLPEDFLELNELDYMFLELRLLYRLFGDSVDEEKLTEYILNKLQSIKENK